MKHRILISPADSKLINKFSNLGIECVLTKPIDAFLENEKYHADMQMLRINNDVFVYECVYEEYRSILNGFDIHICDNPKGKYPDNVSLNAALIENNLYCKVASLDSKVKKHCKDRDIGIIDVKQGYTKCSTLVLGNNAIITADKSISKKAKDNGVDVLLIEPGHIFLSKADYGFIGGASGVIGDTIYFFGNLFLHPQGENIEKFIIKHKMKCLSLCSNKLNDIGGMVLLN